MMTLGIETSGDIAGLAVVDGDGVRAELQFRHHLELSRFLIPRLEEALALARVGLPDIGGIAVAIGPGSFTGLRLGVTAAKTLAYALGLPVCGVGTLEALAADFPAPAGTLLCAVLPASGTQVFAALYQVGPAGPELRAEDALLEARDLGRMLASTPYPVVLLGEPGKHRELLTASGGERLTVHPYDQPPRAAAVARLGRQRLRAGQGTEAHRLAPRYLRPSAAEARRQGTVPEAPCQG